MTDTKLLVEIARCQNARTCLRDQSKGLPCRAIVRSQEVSNLQDFQVPEPWNGHLETAPILFVSSNPSISLTEEYPRWGWNDEQITDYFVNRFNGGRKEWVKAGKYPLQQDGSFNQRAVSYWGEICNRASELLGRPAKPGSDYALTEVVHCKSKSNIGVKDAVDTCAKLYLYRIIEAAAAKIIVIVGSYAEEVSKQLLGFNPESSLLQGPVEIGSLRRFVLFSPAPNSSKPRILSKLLTATDLQRLQAALRVHEKPGVTDND